MTFQFPKNYRIGYKCYSINTDKVQYVKELYDRKIIKYCEIQIKDTPSYEADLYNWTLAKLPYILHSDNDALNASLGYSANKPYLDKLEDSRKKLNAKKIIIHGGIDTGLDENTVRDNIKEVVDSIGGTVYVENQPPTDLNGKRCLFVRPKDFMGFNLCLDIAHASCFESFCDFQHLSISKYFSRFYPEIIHISDGKKESIFDKHLPFGAGNYNLIEALNIIKYPVYCTIECAYDWIVKGDDPCKAVVRPTAEQVL